MFKKFKQRIEDGDTTQLTSTSPLPTVVLASTPKKPSRPSSVHTYSNQNRNKSGNGSIHSSSNARFNRENKWEKRRISSASLTSSRESLLSIDSSATAAVSRVSYNGGESSYSIIGTPVESPLILERVCYVRVTLLLYAVYMKTSLDIQLGKKYLKIAKNSMKTIRISCHKFFFLSFKNINRFMYMFFSF